MSVGHRVCHRARRQPQEDSTRDPSVWSLVPRPGAKEYYDEKSGAAWCVGGDGGFVTYDTPETVQQKAKFATKTKLGGLFYWHIGGDARGPRSLIETGYKTLHDM